MNPNTNSKLLRSICLPVTIWVALYCLRAEERIDLS